MRRITRVRDGMWHRNGVSGVGFYAVLFEDVENGLMVATVFDERGCVSVLRVADLSDPGRGVTFGINSWRGDHYEPELRAAITAADAGRLGPFSVPAARRNGSYGDGVRNSCSPSNPLESQALGLRRSRAAVSGNCAVLRTLT